MKKGYLIIIVVIVIAAITNPDERRHKEIMMNKVKPEMIQGFFGEKEVEKMTNLDAISFMFGSTVVEKFMDNFISTDNYVLFSLTKATWDGETKVVGIGLFGNVLLFKDLDKLKIRI